MKPRYQSPVVWPSDKLRLGRRSIPGKCYFITKPVYRQGNPIIHDPRFLAQDEDACETIVDCLRWLHVRRRIVCHAYVLMRDHFHVQFTLGQVHHLNQVMVSLGTWTARRINLLRNRSGYFWARDFHDHWIRDKRDFWAHLNYIRMNPVKAGYVERPEDWPYLGVSPRW